MGFWNKIFGGGASGSSKSGSSTPSSSKYENIRLVMALTKAVQKEIKDSTPEMTAALILAMTDKNKKDLVERSEGIYLARECWDRISSYELWLAEDGQILVTRKRFQNQPDKPKVESQNILTKLLPKSQKLGGISSLEYALGLVMIFGLDINKLRLIKDKKEVAIYGSSKSKSSRKPKIDIDDPKCTICGIALGSAGTTFGGADVMTTGSQTTEELKYDHTLFLGLVCFPCEAIFCMGCNCGKSHTCPRCQQKTEPAYRKHLHKFSQL